MARSKGFDGLTTLRGRVPDSTTPVAQHAELEAAIAERPDEAALYLVYGDALERAGDPRGPWIALCRAGDAAAMQAYLATHELYLLGALASWVRDRTVVLTWDHGFVRSIRITADPRARLAPTERAVRAIAALADVPSCRYLRELVIQGGALVDTDAVVDRLVALGRPTTLSAIHFEIAGWTAPARLHAAFPRLAEGDAALAAAFAGARAIPVASDLAWHALPYLDDIQALARLAPLHEQLTALHVETGLEVDPVVLTYAGMRMCGGGRTGALAIPTLAGGLIIDGDVVVDGVLEQPFQSAPTIVLGDLRAHALCLDGHLVVMGDLDAAVLYGCCSNYATVVLGGARIGAVVLERGHVLAVHGDAQLGAVHDDEVENGAAQRYLASRGITATDLAGIAAALAR